MNDGGREDKRQKRRDRAGGEKDGHTQAKKFVCEKCTTYARGSLKISRDCQNGGEQWWRGLRGAAIQARTHARTLPNISFNLKRAHLQGIYLAFSYKTIYSVELHLLPRHVKIEAYLDAKPTLS